MNDIYDNDDFRQKKRDVIAAYPSESWKWRVDHMKKGQILAIWFSIQKNKKKIQENDKQLTLFELYPDAMTV